MNKQMAERDLVDQRPGSLAGHWAPRGSWLEEGRAGSWGLRVRDAEAAASQGHPAPSPLGRDLMLRKRWLSVPKAPSPGGG